MNRKSPDRQNDGQLETFGDLSKAVNYNEWIFNLIKPHLGERILEVGCGTGNMIRHLMDKDILGVDIDPSYLQIARHKFKNKKNISFKLFDLEKGLKSFKKFKADTIVCINVLEHIEKDDKFIGECESILSPGGKIILFAPAMPSLFNEMDKTYKHFRRYTKTEMFQKVNNHFDVKCCQYLNSLGVIGWWYNGRLLKRKIIPQVHLSFFDRFFKYFILLEKLVPKPFGLSVFAVGQK
jgi:2-polyprenyl-3-methyl-5-hydroxy-6-metoxy-1,4-benzoquinol methylase